MKEEKKEISYSEIVNLAKKAKRTDIFINPNYTAFLSPCNMPAVIKDYCKKTNQQIPEDKAEITYAVLKSLALEYKRTVDSLNTISGGKIKKLYVVGGGTQNELLCQFTANATQIPVITGPIEATALGNVMMQAIANKDISSLEEGRKIIKNSTEMKFYEPKDYGEWEESYHEYLDIIQLV